MSHRSRKDKMRKHENRVTESETGATTGTERKKGEEKRRDEKSRKKGLRRDD